MAGNKLDHGGGKRKSVFQPHMSFRTASDAFDWLYPTVDTYGVEFDGTKALFNIGFVIRNPLDNIITAPYRNFNLKYADAEFRWYMTGDRSIEKLGEIYGKIPPIWERMADFKGLVNSNYGYQWERNYQLDKVVAMLKDNPETRKASISIYDGKEIDDYRKDTPCTYAVNFTILNGKLDMSVLMRSNDVFYGFCIDQYCFSRLLKLVAERVDVPIGNYFHFAQNMHLYENQWSLC